MLAFFPISWIMSHMVHNPFRGDIPVSPLPDRGQWTRSHSAPPRELSSVPAKFISRARAALRKDRTEIEATPAIHAQEALATVCTSLAESLNLAGSGHVFFDDATGSFWFYPN